MTTPFICVFIALVLVYAIRIPAAVAMAKLPGGYDNKHPRAQQSQLTGWGARSHAAHVNSIETFAPFAAAVIIAHLGNADPGWSSTLAISFVASRVLFCGLYIVNIDKLRSLVWGIGLLLIIGLFFSPMIFPASAG